MNAPDVQIYAYFDLSATGGSFLTLDNTGAKGKLNNAAAILAGDIATNIRGFANRVTIRRGSDSQLFSRTPAGTWSVQLNNEDRRFDPIYASSPYAGNIVPGKRVQIVAGGVVIADGSVEDWNYDYEPGGRSVAIMECADALTQLAAAEFDAWTTTASQTAGPRLTAALNRSEVNYTPNRDFDTGVSVLQGDSVTWGSNVLNYLQLVAASDLGWLYASRDGVLTFRDRHARLNATPAVAFADDGTGIRYQSIELAYGSEKLYNRVGIDREGGTKQTVDDTTSQNTYRVRSFTQTGLLLDSDAQALDMANYLLNIYSEPELRVSSLRVELAALNSTEQAAILALDITSLVQVTFTPNGVGSAVERTCIVEGITHDIVPGFHAVTLSLGDTDRRSTFVLDDTVFGTLTTNVLGF